MSNEYLDNIFDSEKQLNGIAYRLQSLASCFYGVGNKQVADELIEMSADIFESTKVISGAVGTELNRQNKQAWDGIGDLLSACMHSELNEDKQ
jgi:hypothetical protein